MTTPRSRAPNGVMSDKPVAMRLKATEKADLVTMAEQQNRSESSLARLIYLRGLEAMKAAGEA